MVSGTWRVSCSLCSYEHQCAASITMVVRDDGTEAICPEPDTYRIAEETTGHAWDELEAAGRIRTRVAQFCLSCGAVDFYPLGPAGRPEDGLPCHSCGRARLAVLAKAVGCILAPFARLLAPRCPLCKEGRLERALISPI